MEVIDDLHKRNRLHGERLALDDFLDDDDEKEIGGDPKFPSDDEGFVVAARAAIAAGHAGRPIMPDFPEDDSDNEVDR